MPTQRYIGTYILKKKDRVHWESSVFTLCADGYLDIEADVAFAASTNLMPRGKDILFLGKFWGRSTGIPRLSTTIAGTHRSSSSRQEQKAAPPCWLSTVQFQSRQKWKKQSVYVRLSLRVRIVCSLSLRVLRPVEKKIRWWIYRVPQCGGVWEWLCVGLRIWKKHICWSDERQEELTLEPFVVGRYGSKIKSRYMSFNFRVTTEYIAKVLWRFNEKKNEKM